jgi:uncharacterized protein (TIGR02246 family)
MTSVEERLKRLEDVREIHQLFVDYGAHLDAGRFDEYAALFSEEGEISLGPMGHAKGREAIKELMAGTLAGRVGSSFHIISSPIVQVIGDGATSEVMWSVINRDADGQARLSMCGRHRDRLVREDGRWRFAHRRGFIDIPSAYPES